MEAIQGNKKKVLEEPENVEALVKLADANFMIQRFDVSKDYYERALKVDANLIDARISLSNSLIFMQKPDEAIAELDKLLSIKGDHPEALFNKGLILLQSKGDTAGAEQTWKRLIAIHPDHTLARQIQAELERA